MILLEFENNSFYYYEYLELFSKLFSILNIILRILFQLIPQLLLNIFSIFLSFPFVIYNYIKPVLDALQITTLINLFVGAKMVFGMM